MLFQGFLVKVTIRENSYSVLLFLQSSTCLWQNLIYREIAKHTLTVLRYPSNCYLAEQDSIIKIEKENNMKILTKNTQKILGVRLLNLHFEKIKTNNWPLYILKRNSTLSHFGKKLKHLGCLLSGYIFWKRNMALLKIISLFWKRIFDIRKINKNIIKICSSNIQLNKLCFQKQICKKLV